MLPARLSNRDAIERMSRTNMARPLTPFDLQRLEGEMSRYRRSETLILPGTLLVRMVRELPLRPSKVV